jgi:hypothetical protein
MDDEDDLDYWEDQGWDYDFYELGIVTIAPCGDVMSHTNSRFGETVTDALKTHRDELKKKES